MTRLLEAFCDPVNGTRVFLGVNVALLLVLLGGSALDASPPTFALATAAAVCLAPLYMSPFLGGHSGRTPLLNACLLVADRAGRLRFSAAATYTLVAAFAVAAGISVANTVSVPFFRTDRWQIAIRDHDVDMSEAVTSRRSRRELRRHARVAIDARIIDAALSPTSELDASSLSAAVAHYVDGAAAVALTSRCETAALLRHLVALRNLGAVTVLNGDTPIRIDSPSGTLAIWRPAEGWFRGISGTDGVLRKPSGVTLSFRSAVLNEDSVSLAILARARGTSINGATREAKVSEYLTVKNNDTILLGGLAPYRYDSSIGARLIRSIVDRRLDALWTPTSTRTMWIALTPTILHESDGATHSSAESLRLPSPTHQAEAACGTRAASVFHLGFPRPRVNH